MNAIHSPTNERLEREVADIEKELPTLESDPERKRMREETLASHKERLDLVRQQQLRVEQLLHQSESCEASLHRTRLDIANPPSRHSRIECTCLDRYIANDHQSGKGGAGGVEKAWHLTRLSCRHK